MQGFVIVYLGLKVQLSYIHMYMINQNYTECEVFLSHGCLSQITQPYFNR